MFRIQDLSDSAFLVLFLPISILAPYAEKIVSTSKGVFVLHRGSGISRSKYRLWWSQSICSLFGSGSTRKMGVGNHVAPMSFTVANEA